MERVKIKIIEETVEGAAANEDEGGKLESLLFKGRFYRRICEVAS